jgi:hypothetical protein
MSCHPPAKCLQRHPSVYDRVNTPGTQLDGRVVVRQSSSHLALRPGTAAVAALYVSAQHPIGLVSTVSISSTLVSASASWVSAVLLLLNGSSRSHEHPLQEPDVARGVEEDGQASQDTCEWLPKQPLPDNLAVEIHAHNCWRVSAGELLTATAVQVSIQTYIGWQWCTNQPAVSVHCPCCHMLCPPHQASRWHSPPGTC